MKRLVPVFLSMLLLALVSLACGSQPGGEQGGESGFATDQAMNGEPRLLYFYADW